MGLSQSHPKSWPKPWSECTPTALGMWIPPEITWPARDNHATTCHSCHLVGRPPSRRTWDMRLASASLCSFPTWSLFVCTPVSCSHPRLFHPHVDSHPSYRYSPVPIPIAYMSLRPCGSSLYM